MCVLMPTENQLLKSLEWCAAITVPTSEIKAYRQCHGLSYLIGAEWNRMHNRML